MAWYNTYRPQTFDDVIGQELVKSVLENALKKDKIKHAYLLNGPKGVGKTTLARIFANQLNNIASQPESRIDIIEMDAASNTGIDDIRQLIESAKIPPISGKYKVFIIDEVHMLSKSAMNALLKILEEPPTYIVFLLATTNPEKLIPTVLSRLTKLNLSAHTELDIISRLEYIAKTEKLNINKDALKIIAKRSSGSQRDAINLMETISAYELDEYTKHNTAELLGLLPDEILEMTADKIIKREFDTEIVQTLEKTGMDGETILIQLLEFLLDTSFLGDTKHDQLILPIAQLLESKLPITSVSAVLALLHVHLKQPSPSAGTPTPVTLTPTKQSLPTPPPIIEKKTEKPVETKTLVKEPKNPASSPVQGTLDTTVENLTSIILDLSKDSTSPPIFKMLVPDLVVERIEGNTIIFSVTNGIFVAQLSSGKLQEWFKDNINQHLGTTCKIEVEQREAGVSQPILNEQTEPTLEPKEKAKPNVIIEEKKTPKKQTEKVFYKVFGSLPEEIKDSNIPVFSGEIPDPKSKQTEDDNWDNHVDDMFEFE